MQLLRVRICANYFKSVLLKEAHLPGNPQTASVYDLLHKLTDDPPMSPKSWERWFAAHPKTPQPSKLSKLGALLGDQGGTNALVHGGLMQELSVRTTAKDHMLALLERVRRYRPRSPLHLHLDVIEVSSWATDLHGLAWSAVAQVAAGRVLELLAEKWSPRHGTIYQRLPSDLQIRWGQADEAERSRIRAGYKRLKPDLFGRDMAPGAAPNWAITGCDSDVASQHIYQCLFKMAADSQFWLNERILEWTLDMATAALALHASAWTDRYAVMGARITNELIYWCAFHEIFFGDDRLWKAGRGLSSAMNVSGADWDERSLDVFFLARGLYREMLRHLGVSPEQVYAVAMLARERHPLVYS